MDPFDAAQKPRLTPAANSGQLRPAAEPAAAPRSRSRASVRARGERRSIALLSLLLVLQISWSYRVAIMQSPAGDLLSGLCDRLGCTLPTLSAPQLLTTSAVLVRSHPLIKGALLARLEIENSANFAQPVPAIGLTLSDPRGTTIAHRNFAPQAFMTGELAYLERLEPMQRIEIELAITDPGTEAVTYTVHLLPISALSPLRAKNFTE